jgi:2-(1,2-epoxy-1,2-dihydrophenyl)acetyl-CoA isomerase
MILASARQPVIASVQGVAAGAGASLIFAADLAIAAEDAGLNLAYVNVAATPDCSASWSLPRLVGLRKAMEIALLGERIEASEALRLGLFNRVVPTGALEDETRKLAQRLSRAAPLALQGIKRLMRESLNRTLQEQLAAEQLSFASGAATEDFHEALEAFFARRPPHFSGR